MFSVCVYFYYPPFCRIYELNADSKREYEKGHDIYKGTSKYKTILTYDFPAISLWILMQ